MKIIRNFIFLVLLCIFSSVSAATSVALFIWQPQAGLAPMIMCRADGESYESAAQRYMRKFKKNKSLSKLLRYDFKYPVDGFRELNFDRTRRPNFAVLANDPAEMNGGKNGKTWYKSFSRAGANVYVVPVAYNIGLSSMQARECDKLIAREFQGMLALGGDDIATKLYHEKNEFSVDINIVRDKFILNTFKTYLSEGHGAAFGFCRGMQLAAVALGYKLIQDISSLTDNSTQHRWDDHNIQLLPVKNSVLHQAFPDRESIRVNSIHHQAVDLGSNRKGALIPIAYNYGNGEEYPVVEAVQLKNNKGFFVQFHPERMNNSIGRTVISAMVNMAKAVRKNKHGLKSCAKIITD